MIISSCSIRSITVRILMTHEHIVYDVLEGKSLTYCMICTMELCLSKHDLKSMNLCH